MSDILRTLQIVQGAYSGEILLAEFERLMPEIESELARVKVLEDERDALTTCYLCRVAIEPTGTPESRVPRCHQCPEPDSVPDQSGESGKYEATDLEEQELRGRILDTNRRAIWSHKRWAGIDQSGEGE